MVKVGVNYLHPLTLESTIFIKSLETYAKLNNNTLDDNLYNALNDVVDLIGRFLGTNPVEIVESRKTKPVPVQALESIQRIYQCKLCHHNIGKSAEKATAHILNKHCNAAIKKVKPQATSETNPPQNKNVVIKTKENGQGDTAPTLSQSKTQCGAKGASRKQLAKEKRANAVIKLNKKTVSLIQTNLPNFVVTHFPIAEKLKQLPDYDIIEQDLKTLLDPLFPNEKIRLFKFGSRILGSANRNSDLDIFIDIGNRFKIYEETATPETLQKLVRVRKAIEKGGTNLKLLRSIEAARVPILRVCHEKTHIECDLGFSNGLGFCNTKLVEYIFELQPIAQFMCIFLKSWMERTKLTELMSTYSMTLLVIYFLQIKGHLPPLKYLLVNVHDIEGSIGPWTTYFVRKSVGELNIKTIAMYESECKEVLVGFFEMYRDFNFSVNAVSPYLGRSVQINQIEMNMPDRYTKYLSDQSGKPLETKSAVVVQDPIELNRNVAKRITPTLLRQLKDYFKQTTETFAKAN